MKGFQIRMNAGTIAGFVLLAIGGAMMIFGEGLQVAGYPLQTVGFGVLILAMAVYGVGRVVTIVRTPRH